MKKVELLSEEHKELMDEIFEELQGGDTYNHSPLFLAEIIANHLLTNYEIHKKKKD